MKTNVPLHSIKGINQFKEKIGKDVSMFMEFSRAKSQKAQEREFVTKQPKESLSSLTKAKITINNYLGGKYFLTVDEVKITKDKILLMEGKHSKNNTLPALSDIKDGLLKMILYSNLKDITVNGKRRKSDSVLCLTSSKLSGFITSNNTRIYYF